MACWKVASHHLLAEAGHCVSTAVLGNPHLKVHVSRCLIVTHLLTPLCLPVDKVLNHRGGATSSSTGTCSSRRTASTSFMHSALRRCVHAAGGLHWPAASKQQQLAAPCPVQSLLRARLQSVMGLKVCNAVRGRHKKIVCKAAGHASTRQHHGLCSSSRNLCQLVLCCTKSGLPFLKKAIQQRGDHWYAVKSSHVIAKRWAACWGSRCMCMTPPAQVLRQAPLILRSTPRGSST